MTTTHATSEQVVAYLHGSNDDAVFDHLCRCAFCGDLAATLADAIACESGFDPLTGERYHLDGQVDITGMEVLRAIGPGERLRHAADARILAFPVAPERLDEDVVSVRIGDRDVKVDICEDPPGQLLARAREKNGGAPVAGIEVRVELRGYDEDDLGFELYAWGVTEQDGRVHLGPVRPVEPGFASGHRFVLGVVLPPSDD